MIKGMFSPWECLNIPCLSLTILFPFPLNISKKDQPTNLIVQGRSWEWYLLNFLRALHYRLFSKRDRLLGMRPELIPNPSIINFVTLITLPNLSQANSPYILYGDLVWIKQNNICKCIYNKNTTKVHFLFSPACWAVILNSYRSLEEVGTCPDLVSSLDTERDGWERFPFHETHSSFILSERLDGVWEVLFYNFGSAVVETIMGKVLFKLFAKNRVSFSSAI